MRLQILPMLPDALKDKVGVIRLIQRIHGTSRDEAILAGEEGPQVAQDSFQGTAYF